MHISQLIGALSPSNAHLQDYILLLIGIVAAFAAVLAAVDYLAERGPSDQ